MFVSDFFCGRQEVALIIWYGQFFVKRFVTRHAADRPMLGGSLSEWYNAGLSGAEAGKLFGVLMADNRAILPNIFPAAAPGCTDRIIDIQTACVPGAITMAKSNQKPNTSSNGKPVQKRSSATPRRDWKQVLWIVLSLLLVISMAIGFILPILSGSQ